MRSGFVCAEGLKKERMGRSGGAGRGWSNSGKCEIENCDEPRKASDMRFAQKFP